MAPKRVSQYMLSSTTCSYSGKLRESPADVEQAHGIIDGYIKDSDHEHNAVETEAPEMNAAWALMMKNMTDGAGSGISASGSSDNQKGTINEAELSKRQADVQQTSTSSSAMACSSMD